MNGCRTRIAPSPTGEDLHIGNAYTALINYVLAKKNNGQFIIRIEDTDRTRLVKDSEEHILQSLHWLGIAHDEGPDIGGPHSPYRQSDRLSEYKKYAQDLVNNGHAYYCFCSAERLTEMRKQQEQSKMPPMYDGLCKHLSKEEIEQKLSSGTPFVIRLSVPDVGTTSFIDAVRGEIIFENRLIDDQVLLKTDGYPTYHLGVVVDDHLMGITHIIRGEEWISSTPKHILLYQYFGWQTPVIAHMSVLRNPDKTKLSKRKNPVWVSWFGKQGYLPEAIRNYLGTMAWNFPGGKELFTTDEMIRVFDLSQIQTTAPVFDIVKLRWMNGEYLRSFSDDQLADGLIGFDKQYGTYRPLIMKIMPLIRDRMKVYGEFSTLAGFFMSAPTSYEQEVSKESAQSIHQSLSNVDWKHDVMEQAIRSLAQEKGRKAKDVFMDLRVLITGKTVGPPLLESLEILGKEETLSRLSAHAGSN